MLKSYFLKPMCDACMRHILYTGLLVRAPVLKSYFLKPMCDACMRHIPNTGLLLRAPVDPDFDPELVEMDAALRRCVCVCLGAVCNCVCMCACVWV